MLSFAAQGFQDVAWGTWPVTWLRTGWGELYSTTANVEKNTGKRAGCQKDKDEDSKVLILEGDGAEYGEHGCEAC